MEDGLLSRKKRALKLGHYNFIYKNNTVLAWAVISFCEIYDMDSVIWQCLTNVVIGHKHNFLI